MRREATYCTEEHQGFLPLSEATRGAPRSPVDYCSRCWLRPLVQHERDLDDSAGPGGGVAVHRVGRGEMLYRRGEPLRALFVVREGLIKSRALSYEGQDKITALHLPGEMFGLLAIASGQHSFDALAVAPSVVCAIPFALLAARMEQDEAIERRLFQVLSCASARHQGFSEALEHLDAEERIAALLLNLSHRYARTGHDPDAFPFPLRRVEVANYAGLAHETVSRVVSKLQSEAIVNLSGGIAEIARRDELERIAAECDWTDRCRCDHFGC